MPARIRKHSSTPFETSLVYATRSQLAAHLKRERGRKLRSMRRTLQSGSHADDGTLLACRGCGKSRELGQRLEHALELVGELDEMGGVIVIRGARVHHVYLVDEQAERFAQLVAEKSQKLAAVDPPVRPIGVALVEVVHLGHVSPRTSTPPVP